jgi:hypothetical protein
VARVHARSILKAFDELTGDVIDAKKVLGNYETVFEVRKVFAREQIIPICTECYQPLKVSRRYKHLFFSHKSNSHDCALKTGKWSKKQEDSYYKAIATREGSRHKYLKSLIGERLSLVEGVDLISVDDRFIQKEDGKRRPDVHCIFNGKELVFEIQISHLSLKYILSRHDFYKKHNIYLVWILDNIDVKNQERFELDIKYLTSYQNFFSFHEESEEFNLLCRYKRVRIDDLEVMSKWRKEVVGLQDLKFDFQHYEVYWYDYGLEEQRAKDRLPELRKIKEEKERREAEREEKQRKKASVDGFKKELLEVWENGSHPYFPMDHFINYTFDEGQIKYLNSLLKLDAGNKKYHEEAILVHCVLHRDSPEFLDIIFFSGFIQLDVNDIGKSNTTLFQALYNKRNKYSLESYWWTLFGRGYKLKDSDVSFLKSEILKYNDEKEYERRLLLFRTYESLCGFGDDLMSTASENRELLYTLYSAKINKPYGWRVSYKQLVDTIIKNYPRQWPFVRIAYDCYHGIWNKVISEDRTGMVSRNLADFESKSWVLDYNVLKLVGALYPELKEQIEGLRKKYRVTDGHWTSEI